VGHSLERQGGLGIGLTLARQLVELHGGTIEARSRGLGHGSQFVVRLPVVLTTARPAGPADAPARPAAPLRIVVADDNRDAAESLALLLELGGHRVHVAFDGAEAWATVDRERPDVALLDIGMPSANGYQVARRIRQEPWGRAIYLVALTGWGQDADRARAHEAGFDEHLVKPVPPEALDAVLAAVAGRAAATA
jgi:CheY-like chemotaxis protein